MEKFHNSYNPAYKVDRYFDPINFVDIFDVDDSSWDVEGYRYETFNRTWVKHTELLTRKQALIQSIQLLKDLLIKQEQELEEIDEKRQY
jgi:hypothetical protein